MRFQFKPLKLPLDRPFWCIYNEPSLDRAIFLDVVHCCFSIVLVCIPFLMPPLFLLQVPRPLSMKKDGIQSRNRKLSSKKKKKGMLNFPEMLRSDKSGHGGHGGFGGFGAHGGYMYSMYGGPINAAAAVAAAAVASSSSMAGGFDGHRGPRGLPWGPTPSVHARDGGVGSGGNRSPHRGAHGVRRRFLYSRSVKCCYFLY